MKSLKNINCFHPRKIFAKIAVRQKIKYSTPLLKKNSSIVTNAIQLHQYPLRMIAFMRKTHLKFKWLGIVNLKLRVNSYLFPF